MEQQIQPQEENNRVEGRVFKGPPDQSNTSVPRTPMGRMIGSEFVRHAGKRCPVCEGGNISDGDMIVGPLQITVPCGCGDCNASWLRVYRLCGYDPIETMKEG